MTARWPATESISDWSERKQEWFVSVVTELPCKHLVSAKRHNQNKATAISQAKHAVADKVRRHRNHSKGK